MQFPGWTNAWTMPIKTRVDMLTTGVRTPVGIKVFGTDLDEIERIGVALERLLAPHPRHPQRALRAQHRAASTSTSSPTATPWPATACTVGDVERVIEAAIGGAPIGTTIEGRNRFSINVRYPQDLRSDLERLRAGAGAGARRPAGGTGGAGDGMAPPDRWSGSRSA